jgi:hypothetical protein
LPKSKTFLAGIESQGQQHQKKFNIFKCGGEQKAREDAISYVRDKSDELGRTQTFTFRSLCGLPIQEWEKQRSAGKLDADGCLRAHNRLSTASASIRQSENRGIPGFLSEESELYFPPAIVVGEANGLSRREWKVITGDRLALLPYVTDMSKYAILKAPQAESLKQFLSNKIGIVELRTTLKNCKRNYLSTPVEQYRDRLCIAYLGGSFAGDGSVGVYCSANGTWKFCLSLGCNNCPRLLDMIRAYLDSLGIRSMVTISPALDKYGKRVLCRNGEPKKDKAALEIAVRSTIAFAQMLLPFSSDMRPQLEIFIAARQLFENAPRPRSEENEQQICEYAAEIKRLKRL